MLATSVKILPGCKTDVADAVWLAELMEHGLRRGSFVPPAVIRELRDLARFGQAMLKPLMAGERDPKVSPSWPKAGCGSRSPSSERR